MPVVQLPSVLTKINMFNCLCSSYHDGEQSSDCPSVQENGQKEDNEEDGDSEGKEKEEGPHQQSFLSFLNLKPGTIDIQL